VLRGAEVDLGLLPVQRCWPGDPAPFITLPAVITRDPRDGTRNVGMYRMQVIDRATTFMHWQIHKDGRADWLASDGRIPVVVALGLDPITAYSASAPLPKHVDELMLAGFLPPAMTMRGGAIYPSIVVGKPPQEDAWLGKATERIFLPAVRATLPEIVDYDLPVAGAFHNCCIVSIRKSFPGQAQKVMH